MGAFPSLTHTYLHCTCLKWNLARHRLKAALMEAQAPLGELSDRDDMIIQILLGLSSPPQHLYDRMAQILEAAAIFVDDR